MVPVLLAAPPWANADALNDNATSRANMTLVQRLMLFLLMGAGPCEPVPTRRNAISNEMHELHATTNCPTTYPKRRERTRGLTRSIPAGGARHLPGGAVDH